MGERGAAYRWSTSPLGSLKTWPQSLTNAGRMKLPARAQIALLWGPQDVTLSNDAYVTTIGDKHPRARGRPLPESWSELWDDLEPVLRAVRDTGNRAFAKDRASSIERPGFGEEGRVSLSGRALAVGRMRSERGRG